jgi:hypothetical protein
VNIVGDMQPYSSLPTKDSAKLSLALGIAVGSILAIFTASSVIMMITGNVATLENSRLINMGYATLSTCGESIAIVGTFIGVSAALRKRQLQLIVIIALALNILGLVLFLPATVALLFNGLFGLLDHFI